MIPSILRSLLVALLLSGLAAADSSPAFDLAAAQKEPALMAGNYVILDHGNGEFSMLAHFRHGSLAFKPGERVERGQLLGRMGHSGMGSGLVHVHYELRTIADLFDADALPAAFQGFRRMAAPLPSPAASLRVGS
jgi:murein DD-endopeptidase MepM/ murein hydrolase activator NlpD